MSEQQYLVDADTKTERKCWGLTAMRYPCSLIVGHSGNCVHYTYKKYTPMVKIPKSWKEKPLTLSEPSERPLNRLIGLSGL